MDIFRCDFLASCPTARIVPIHSRRAIAESSLLMSRRPGRVQTSVHVKSRVRRAARDRKGMAVLRLRPRWRARGSHVHADRHCQAQRRRSAGLARRCARPHRQDAAEPARRTPLQELGPGTEARSGRIGQITRRPLRPEPAADQSQTEYPRSLRRMLTHHYTTSPHQDTAMPI